MTIKIITGKKSSIKMAIIEDEENFSEDEDLMDITENHDKKTDDVIPNNIEDDLGIGSEEESIEDIIKKYKLKPSEEQHSLEDLVLMYQSSDIENKQSIKEKISEGNFSNGQSIQGYAAYLSEKKGIEQGGGEILAQALEDTLDRYDPKRKIPYEHYLKSTMGYISKYMATKEHSGDAEQRRFLDFDPYIKAVSERLRPRIGDPEEIGLPSVPDFIEDMKNKKNPMEPASEAEKSRALYLWDKHDFQRVGRVDDAMSYWNKTLEHLSKAVNENPEILNEITMEEMQRKSGSETFPISAGNMLRAPVVSRGNSSEFRLSKNLYEFIIDQATKEEKNNEQQVSQGQEVIPGKYQRLLETANNASLELGQEGVRTDLLSQPSLPQGDTLDQEDYPGKYYLSTEIVDPTKGNTGVKDFQKRLDFLSSGKIVSPVDNEGQPVEQRDTTSVSPEKMIDAKDQVNRKFTNKELMEKYQVELNEWHERKNTGISTEGSPPTFDEYVDSIVETYATTGIFDSKEHDEGSLEDVVDQMFSGDKSNTKWTPEDMGESSLLDKPKLKEKPSWLPEIQPGTWGLTTPSDNFINSPEEASSLLWELDRLKEESRNVGGSESDLVYKKIDNVKKKLIPYLSPEINGPLSSLYKEYGDSDLKNKLLEVSDRTKLLERNKLDKTSKGITVINEMMKDIWSKDPIGDLKYEIMESYSKTPASALFYRSLIGDRYKKNFIPNEEQIDFSERLNKYEVPPEVNPNYMGKKKEVPKNIGEKQKISMIARDAMSQIISFLANDDNFDEFQKRMGDNEAVAHTLNSMRGARFSLYSNIIKEAACL